MPVKLSRHFFLGETLWRRSAGQIVIDLSLSVGQSRDCNFLEFGASDSHRSENLMVNRRRFLSTSVLAFAGGSLLACSKSPLLSVANANSSGDNDSEKASVTVIRFSDSGQSLGPVHVAKVHKTSAEWKQLLTPMQFEVTRQKGTERAFTGQYYDLHDKGLYHCICCDNALFSSRRSLNRGRDGLASGLQLRKKMFARPATPVLG